MAPTPAGAAGQRPRQVAAAVHVHSDASSGELSLTGLQRLARAEGVEALVLSENLVLRFRFAPWPLNYFGELRHSLPDLIAYGIESHFDDLRRARLADDGLILLAGVEVTPYYYWTGSPVGGGITLHDMQRNLLVIPRPAAATDSGSSATATGTDLQHDPAEVIAGLPVIHNPGAEGWGWASLPLLVPSILLAVLGAHGLRASRRRGRRGSSLFALTVGIVLFAYNFPYRAPVLSPYDAQAGFDPHRGVIDYAAVRGALTFWSLPEASDRRRLIAGPVPVQLSTEPYPQALSETDRYTGFGGLYADTVTLWKPHGMWDELLRSYLSGERERPTWLIGETAFHYSGQAGKELGQILTVLEVTTADIASVFEALRNGHSYATRRGPAGDIRLADFAAASAGRRARIGETLMIEDGPLTVALEVVDSKGGELPITVELLRGGSSVARWAGTTPFATTFDTDSPTSDAADLSAGTYYRVVVTGPRPLQIVSNPIFVRRR